MLVDASEGSEDPGANINFLGSCDSSWAFDRVLSPAPSGAELPPARGGTAADVDALCNMRTDIEREEERSNCRTELPI